MIYKAKPLPCEGDLSAPAGPVHRASAGLLPARNRTGRTAFCTKACTSVVALLLLAACGGGSSADTPIKADQLVAIGNSLTMHPVDASIGWNHASGMAASDQAHDFVHLAASKLILPVRAARYEAAIERNPGAPVPYLDMATPLPQLIAQATADIDSQTAVIVELGDNVLPGGDEVFAASYGQLLDAVAAAKPVRLVCVSTWWLVASRDAMMKAACTAHGGTFVFIGDIYPTRADVIPDGENGAIASHPHDPSMAEIARRIAASLAA